MKKNTRIARKIVAAEHERLQRKCHGKAPHHSRKDAKAAMNRLIEKYGYNKKDFSVYRCPICSYFHFGHLPTNKRDYER